MIPVLSFVQEGQIASSTFETLEKGLADICQSAFGDEPAIRWVEVQPGNGFSGAQPSKASLVRMEANRSLAQEERVEIMEKICDFWMENTGCSINEIVAAVSDPLN